MVPPRAAAAVVWAALAVGLGPAARAEPGPTLALGGDVFVDSPMRLTLEQRGREVGLEAAYRELLAEVAPSLSSADLAVVNLETPISARLRERGRGEPPIFNAAPEILDALIGAGVDAVTLANNHAHDQGLAGLEATLAAARARGVATVGVGAAPAEACGPLRLATPAGSVAICAWAESLNVTPHDAAERERSGGPHVAVLRDGTMERCLARARAEADLAIAVVHWTTLTWTGPRRQERRLVQRAVDAGADLVVGHGPHVPGPAARLRAADGREALVLFSLGNLLGTMGREDDLWRSPRWGVRDAPIVRVATRRAADGRLVADRLEVEPFWIADARPRSPWWPSGAQPLARPLSISRELERLARAACGFECGRMARGYERRARLLARAWVVEPAPAPEAASAAPPPARAPADAPLDLAAGVALPLRFRHNRVTAEVTDQAALERIARALLARRDARVELTGSAAPGEDALPPERLGERRARAAMWLLSALGPSRARFVMRGGGSAPGVRLSLVP